MQVLWNVLSECIFEARVGFYPEQNPEDIQEEVKAWILKTAEKNQWLKKEPFGLKQL
jgi:acetylornithine deacetylase